MSQILLIDDDLTQLRVRETILRSAGFDVALATNGDSALSSLKSSPQDFGMVITDHFLSEGTGVDLVRRIRAFLPDLPVIVFSGMPDLDSEYDGLNVIVRQKPLPPPELISLIQTYVREN